MILGYVIDDEWFEYEVDYELVYERLSKYLVKERTKEDIINYLISCDGCKLDLLEDYVDEIHDLFYKDAVKYYHEQKNSDNGVSQKDFI